jgi:hypothetical protein
MTLPVEVIEMILVYSPPSTILRFSATNSALREWVLNNDHIWKRKAYRDYNPTRDSTLRGKQILYSGETKGIDKYRYLYETQCISCNTRTKSRDLFYNHVLCKICQFVNPYYCIISKAAAKKRYNVTSAGLSTLNTKTKHIRLTGANFYAEYCLEKDVKELERRTIVLRLD